MGSGHRRRFQTDFAVVFLTYLVILGKLSTDLESTVHLRQGSAEGNQYLIAERVGDKSFYELG